MLFRVVVKALENPSNSPSNTALMGSLRVLGEVRQYPWNVLIDQQRDPKTECRKREKALLLLVQEVPSTSCSHPSYILTRYHYKPVLYSCRKHILEISF